MATPAMNSMETRATGSNKYGLKLLGISNTDQTYEEILEFLSQYIQPSSIEALFFDSFNNFFVLFVTDIDSIYRLIGKRLEFESHCIKIYPLFDYFLINNVYPCIKNDEIRDIFRTFGNVVKVSSRPIVSSSFKFSHVLSGQREVSFLLPGKESAVCIPLNVVHPPHSFHVQNFCCACLKEGHSVLRCPAVENDQNSQIIKCEGSDSNGELEALVKSEEFQSYEKVENNVDADNDGELEALVKSEEFQSFEKVENNADNDSDDEVEDLIKSEEFHSFENREEDSVPNPQSQFHRLRTRSKKAGKN